jgi:hypothetical protein
MPGSRVFQVLRQFARFALVGISAFGFSTMVGAADPVLSTIYFQVLNCPQDAHESPYLISRHAGDFSSRFVSHPINWTRRRNGVLTGTFAMEPGWIRGRLETTHCNSVLVHIAVLPGHVRHYSEILVSKKASIGRIDDADLIVAGSLPLHGLTAKLDANTEVIVDDDAYYFRADHLDSDAVLTVHQPGQSRFDTHFRVILAHSIPWKLWRRDIGLTEYLDRFRGTVSARKINAVTP